MAALVKTAIKFIFVKPAKNYMKDLLSIGPKLERDNHTKFQMVLNEYPDMNFLKITPLEHVPLEMERGPRTPDSSDILDRLRY